MRFDPMRPIWLQVMGDIETAIAAGAREPGEKLPGGRDLALQYGINPNTAARIYQELEREGLCQTQRGLGTFVTGSEEAVQKLREEMARRAVARFLTDLKGMGLSREDAIQLIQKEDEPDDHQ